MKTIIPIFTVFLLSCAPPLVQFKEEDNLVQVYEDVTGTKAELYLKANNWMIETFRDAESVIQHNDKEEGVVIGKYLMAGTVQRSNYGTSDSRVYAIIDIRVKENKARIEIKPQGEWRYDVSGFTIYSYSKEDAKMEMETLAEKFHSSLLKKDVKF